MSSFIQLPETPDLFDKVDSLIQLFRKDEIELLAIALGPKEYLQLCSRFEGMVVKNYQGIQVFAKADDGISPIFKDNKDSFRMILKYAKDSND